MITMKQIARRVALKLDSTADRYDQIWAIKQEFIKADAEILATDRESIDAVLDILYHDYAFCA